MVRVRDSVTTGLVGSVPSRHGHTFPVDALYQSNVPTEDELERVLSTVTSGYVSLVGPPGSGKSTLLAAGLLPIPRAALVRYLAFVPDYGQGLGRAEALHFLHDIVKQLKRQNLGAQILPGTEIGELRAQLEVLLHEASARFEGKGVRTIIVVDGLDHVPREEKPQQSLLCELPLPTAIPTGVVFLLGTQRLDLEGIPRAVRDQAAENERRVLVGPLPPESVTRLANAAGVPDDVERSELYARTEGHPLSTRYVIQRLLAAATPESRQRVLSDEAAYGGDVTAFYQRAWHDLENDTDAREGLAYLALAEGPISTTGLDSLVGSKATDAAVRAARHLLVQKEGAWSIFHNSFRLFLRAQTSLRHDAVDGAAVQRRYRSLADMARNSGPEDAQRWMELRYRARAGDHDAVDTLAKPQRFRAQFVEGRDPGDIHDDINLAFATAGVLRRDELMVDLMLARHEISMRSEALGDDVFQAHIDLGNLRAAEGLLEAEGVTLTAGKGFMLVDAFLSSGDIPEARELFDQLEPIDKLLGFGAA